MADAMLGSLARKLRAAGFDTVYYKSGDDRGIIRLCLNERRILVTADRQLTVSAGAKGMPAILVTGDDDLGRAASMAKAAKQAGILLTQGAPRCSLCNGVLQAMGTTEARRGVPASVADKHRLFYRCTECGQLYWKGSHWKELRLIGRRLSATNSVPLSLSEGKRAVELARKTLDSFVTGKEPKRAGEDSGIFANPRGVFVTLNLLTGASEELRGCIGFPYPVKSVGEGIKEATVLAASEDPRFPAVTAAELDSILVEVSILTLPRAITASRPQDRPAAVKIGEDGLIVSRPPLSGLLLPQVATEQGLDSSSFLSEACMKAGLPPDAWLEQSTEILSFQADVFSEVHPRGEIVRVELSPTPKRTQS